VQLLVEPFLEAHGADGVEVARSQAKCEAIKGVQNAVVTLNAGRVISRVAEVVRAIRVRGGRLSGDWAGRTAEAEAQDDCQSSLKRLHFCRPCLMMPESGIAHHGTADRQDAISGRKLRYGPKTEQYL